MHVIWPYRSIDRHVVTADDDDEEAEAEVISQVDSSTPTTTTPATTKENNEINPNQVQSPPKDSQFCGTINCVFGLCMDIDVDVMWDGSQSTGVGLQMNDCGRHLFGMHVCTIV